MACDTTDHPKHPARVVLVALVCVIGGAAGCGGGGGGFVTGSGGAEGSACTSAFVGEGCLYATVGSATIGRRMRCVGDVWQLIETCPAKTVCTEKPDPDAASKVLATCEKVAPTPDAGAADGSEDDAEAATDVGAFDAGTFDAGLACGDGTCQAPESADSCASDCGTRDGPVCGDGGCEADDTESLLTCGSDCGSTVEFPCLLADCEGAWDACEADAACSAAFSCVGTSEKDAEKRACVAPLGDAPRGLINALAACLHANGCVDP